MRRAAALVATAALLGACSSSGAAAPTKASSQVLTGTPPKGATACSVLPKEAVAQVYGAKVIAAVPRAASRRVQTRQSGCIVDVAGEKTTALAVYLWYGDGFKDQWTDEVDFDGTEGFSEQPYGLEAYGSVAQAGTTLVVRERGFALRLLCGPTPAAPDKPLGIDQCARLVDAIGSGFAG